MASTSKESYGIASYVISRHRKNKVFIWQSRKERGRVYEFLVSSRFKVPGLVSWKCMHCMQLRAKLKRERQPVKDLKIPLVLIDNDVIREDPDEPLNARHFCKGKDVVDAVLKRTKLQFYESCSSSDDPPEITVDRFSDALLEAVPLDLDAYQKRQMKQSLDDKCERVMKKVIQKRKRKSPTKPNAGLLKREREVKITMDNGFHIEDVTGRPDVADSSLSGIDENDYIDVVGESSHML
ncbi:hypothetical protein RB195_015825 [Necator americanus]|uniref:Uncharacterized protein n=2 Tax=Necator americanus TaxID=51031 RepID=W2SW62_NECAM|nr:hypothetical protein NECAME_04248 [Necator americanus]ETN73855.1 hypothetical protein NECAME_04248 [Necator americanus]